jgi:hypothetical protein
MSRLQQRSYQAIRQFISEASKASRSTTKAAHKPGWDMPSVLQPLAVKTHPWQDISARMLLNSNSSDGDSTFAHKIGFRFVLRLHKTGLPGP